MIKFFIFSLSFLTLFGSIASAGENDCSGNNCLERKEFNRMKITDHPFDKSGVKINVIPDYGDDEAGDELPVSIFSMAPLEDKESSMFFDGPPLESSDSENTIRPMALTPNYTPGCYTFGVNLYSEFLASPGASYCIYYEIQQKSRVQLFQLNQNNQFMNGFDILVNQDINGDYNLSYVTQGSGSPTMHLDVEKMKGHKPLQYNTVF